MHRRRRQGRRSRPPLAAAVLALVAAGVAAAQAPAATVDLATQAAGHFDRAAGPVAAAGDVNGDGYGDVVVAQPVEGPFDPEAGPDVRGGAYVAFGRSPLGAHDPDRLGSAGFRIVGAHTPVTSDRVAGAGDFNGDGLADVVLSAGNAEPFSRRIPGVRIRQGVEGAAYVVFGSRAPADVDLANLGGRGVTIKGIGAGAAAGAGDFNGDGRTDLVVGDTTSDVDGTVHVVYGGATGTLDVAKLGARGVSFPGAPGDQGVGRAVAPAGDVNGDGRADVVAGAPISVGAPIPDDAGEVYGPGAAYVIFGRASNRGVPLHRLGAGGFRISTRRFGFLGIAVAGAGDVNGDGRADVLVGAPLHPGPRRRGPAPAGAAYVVFGGPAARLDVDRLGARGFAIRGDPAVPGAGSAVAPAGDLDGDGLADVLVGAVEPDSDDDASPSRAYVVHGHAGTADVELGRAGGDPRNMELHGLPYDRLGESVAVTDFDGDGRIEVVVGVRGGCGGGARADTLVGERWGASIRAGGAVYLYAPGHPGSTPGIVTGGPGGDVLAGSAGDDRIAGRRGDDRLAGAAGGDCLFGEAGDDRLDGGPGGDALLAGAGRDVLDGGGGPDALRGDAGDDVLRAGPGQDGLEGGGGDDVLSAGAGPDLVEDGPGDDRLLGGAGEDFLRDGWGRNVLLGGTGPDFLNGGRDRDVLRGGAGDDVVYGGSGAVRDLLDGGAGDDRLTGERGRDLIVGGTGNDRVETRDGAVDLVRCGPGRDRVRADRRDRLSGCESVTYRPERPRRLPIPGL